jgi:hypothetical protein
MVFELRTKQFLQQSNSNLSVVSLFQVIVHFSFVLFFVEQRRRTARYFIKVEKDYTGQNKPNTHSPHTLVTKLPTRHRKNRNKQKPQSFKLR